MDGAINFFVKLFLAFLIVFVLFFFVVVRSCDSPDYYELQGGLYNL